MNRRVVIPVSYTHLSALKMTYYEAFSEARKALNSEEKTGSVGENIILQDNFDMKA